MGYKREPKVYRLRFAEPDMDGLVVRARSMPMGQLMELMRLMDLGSRAEFTTDDAARIDLLFRGFASALVDWNLEEDGPTGTVPVPPTIEGLYAQDMDFVMRIITGWMDTVTAVDPAVGKASGSGGPSLAASLPMEPLSPSPRS